MVLFAGDSLVSNREVATRLGVSAATVRRWADDGTLPCVTTAGGHRRFRARDVEAFQHRAPGRHVDSDLLPLLLAAPDARATAAVLMEVRADAGHWPPVVDRVGSALTRMRAAVTAGTLATPDARLLTERLQRACTLIVETLPRARHAPAMVLACAEGDDHELPLRLLEPVLAEQGWNTHVIGRRVAMMTLGPWMTRHGIGAAVMHAGATMARPHLLGPQAALLARVCRARQGGVIAVGNADWSHAGPGVEHAPSMVRAAILSAVLWNKVQR